MAKDQNYWEQDSSALPGVDEPGFQAFEAHYGITLPLFLKEMYRLQNGGQIQNAEQELVLLPLGTPDPIFGQMRSLEEYANADGASSLTSIYLDWIEEEFKNPARVIVIASYHGHVVYALDFGSPKSDKEPSVVSLDFECVDKDKVAPTFEKWIKKLTKVSSGPGVNWNEIEKYEVLYRSSFQHFVTLDGTPELVENVLCKSGERGLIHFEKKEWKGQITTLNRCAIENGVDGLWFKVDKFRPDPNRTFTLQLQPSNDGDIRWVMDELKSGNRWKTQKMKGVPVYCTVESQDRESLERLAELLKQQGFVDQRDAPVFNAINLGLNSLMDQFTEMLGAFQSQLLKPKPEKATYEPDLELPRIDTADPATRSNEENVQELIRIIRSWAGQIRKIQTVEDAEAFVESFQIYINRLIAISMHQGRLTNLDAELLTVSDSLRKEIQNLMNRDGRAWSLIDSHKREAEWDAVRSLRLGNKIDEFLERFNDSARAVSEFLKQVLSDNAFEPSRYQAAYEELEKSHQELRSLKDEMDLLEWGWVLGKRKFHPVYKDLVEQMNLLTTKHRPLFKQHRDDFEKLKNLLMT